LYFPPFPKKINIAPFGGLTLLGINKLIYHTNSVLSNRNSNLEISLILAIYFLKTKKN